MHQYHIFVIFYIYVKMVLINKQYILYNTMDKKHFIVPHYAFAVLS